MTKVQFALVGQAFDLLHTPYALEILATLGSDDQRSDETGPRPEHRRAIEVLRDLGAVETRIGRRHESTPILTLTRSGRNLFETIVAIDARLGGATEIGLAV